MTTRLMERPAADAVGHGPVVCLLGGPYVLVSGRRSGVPEGCQRLLAFLAARAVPGLEVVTGDTYSRTLALPHGPAVVHLTPREDVVACALDAADLRDVGAAVERCRRLLDLDADPAAVDDLLGADPVLGPTVRAHPGLRVPGHVDGLEVAVRAVVGQQISVSGARTVLATEHPLRAEVTLPDGQRIVVTGYADRLEVDDRTLYLDPATPDLLREHRAAVRDVHLLPGFDELVLGYADRSMTLPAEHADRVVPGGNGVFRPTVVDDGVVVGTWRAAGTGARRRLEAEPFTAWAERVAAVLPERFTALPA